MKVEIEGDPLPISMEFEFQQVYDGDSSPINMGPEFQQDKDTCHDDVLSAMLKRKRRPRNWGEKELKQLTKLYHLSGGERKGIGNLYKQITEATGSPMKTIQGYLTFLRTPSKHSSNEDGLLAKFFMLKEAECRNERQETMNRVKESAKRKRSSNNLPGDTSTFESALHEETANDSKVRRKDLNRDARREPLRYVPFQSLLCNYDLPVLISSFKREVVGAVYGVGGIVGAAAKIHLHEQQRNWSLRDGGGNLEC